MRRPDFLGRCETLVYQRHLVALHVQIFMGSFYYKTFVDLWLVFETVAAAHFLGDLFGQRLEIKPTRAKLVKLTIVKTFVLLVFVCIETRTITLAVRLRH